MTRFSTLKAIELPSADDPGGDAGRLHEHLHAAALDELREPLGRVEEVEGVAGGRGVEDEEVVAALLVDLEELLHRHVLLGAGQGVGELAVDPVLEDPVAASRHPARACGRARRRWPSRPACIAQSSPRISEPARSKSVGSTQPGRVLELLQAQRVGQSLGGVDRQHADLLAARGEPGGERGRGGRLAHAARARADADPAALDDVRDRGHQTRAPARRSSDGTSSCGLKMKGSVLTGDGHGLLEALQLVALGARAPVLRERRAHGGPGGPVGVLECPLELGCLALRESLGVERVHVDPVDGHPDVTA